METKQPTIDDWRKAGEIAARARDFAAKLAKPNTLLLDIADKVEQKILDDGAITGFPANLSLNTIAAHYTPHVNDQTILTKEHVLKIDIGACMNGAIGDTALTVDLTGKYEKLVESSHQALANVTKLLQKETIKTTLGDIGKTIQETIESYGYKPVMNLSGHGIGTYEIHKTPSFPNYNNNNKQRITVGQTFAVEPFATDGAGKIKEGTNPNIFEPIERKPIRDSNARAVFTEIMDKYKGLPFAKRWLISQKLNEQRIDSALRMLKANGNIISHSPLVEVANGIVTQAEHTYLVEEDKVVCLTR
ncbi:type II methionyl aminopeptidase [Candidatus Woesearchaeota archaeon]|nr:type II methionyl aminopeptidase [Candidatus Woesearchaeota archaeon]